MPHRHIAALALAAVAAVSLVAAPLAAASPDSHPRSAHRVAATHVLAAKGEAGPFIIAPGEGLTLIDIAVHARQTAAGKVSGDFSASGRLTLPGVAIPAPISFGGPVTCLRVSGDTVSFLYPVTKVQPVLAGPLLSPTSILITFRTGHDGRSPTVGFLPPVPTVLTHGCAPRITPLAFDGTLAFS